jgi:hypothetical protein
VLALAQGVAFELDALGVAHDAIKDGVGEGGRKRSLARILTRGKCIGALNRPKTWAGTEELPDADTV